MVVGIDHGEELQGEGSANEQTRKLKISLKVEDFERSSNYIPLQKDYRPPFSGFSGLGPAFIHS